MPPLWNDLKQRRQTAPDQLLSRFQLFMPPVPVRLLAGNLGIFVLDVPTPGWNGAAHSGLPYATIWVRANLEDPEKNWLIAHELGHILLEVNGRVWVDVDTTIATPAELRASSFASDLLVPLWMIHPYIAAGWQLPALQTLFQAPQEVIQQRVLQVYGHAP